ncbi:MAG: hypothetical protein M3Z84_07240, partial [Actinomycetota bacterium]|nr:hypothetical protein [Actinomycetota bacterium]
MSGATGTARPAAGLVSRTRVLPVGPDPLSVLGADGFGFFHDRWEMATAGVAARIRVDGSTHRLERAAAEAERVLSSIEVVDPLGLPGTGPIAVGALPFADGAEGELVVPSVVVGRTRAGLAWITETGGGFMPHADVWRRNGSAPRPDRSAGGRAKWNTAVTEVLRRIRAGRLEKVVLAREVVVDGGSRLDRAG